MKGQTYISLDIETTGFNADSDQIIEIAAIKFDKNGKTIDTFDTTVNPKRPIPAIITHITGIKDSDLTHSPTLPDITADFLKFIGKHPIVGHNISFDVNFLNGKGMRITNELYDTLDLASILCPGLPSYSLGTLTQILNIRHENKHRALSDTVASKDLFLMLLKRIQQIEPETFKEIKSILNKSKWPLRGLFLEYNPTKKVGNKKRKSDNTKKQTDITSTPYSQNPNKESTTQIPPQIFEEFFAPNGPLAKTIPDFETRESQIEIKNKITQSFTKGGHQIIEAGTGTGKTMAYLLSAFNHARKHNTKVVISTYTKNLQEQIFHKDIPLLQKALNQINTGLTENTGSTESSADSDTSAIKSTNSTTNATAKSGTPNQTSQSTNTTPDSTPDSASLSNKSAISNHPSNSTNPNTPHPLTIRAVILKGRKNYISLKRLHYLLTKEFFQNHEVSFLIKVLNWLNTTESGELSELSLQNKEFVMLDEVCCDEITNEESDPQYANQCFLKKARQKAEQSDLIIVNHSLALLDAIKESSIIPEYDHIIFDEAHNLEKVATETLSINLSFNFYIKPFDKLARLIQTEKDDDLQELSTTLNDVITRSEIFFGLLGIFIEKHTDPGQYFFQNLINEPALNSLEWKKVKESAIILNELNSELIDAIEETSTPSNDLFRELKNIQFAIEERQKALNTLFISDDWKERINWTYKTMEGSNCIKSAPLIVGDTLKKLFYNLKHSIILLSATLRTDHSFEYIRKQLSLREDFEESALPSHFDYPDQVKIIIPQDIPRPNTSGYFTTSSRIIKDIIQKNGGRTLILFTSKKALQATYMALAPEMKELGFEILAQNVSGGRGKILEQFKQNPGTSALFGTDSFWEGIDVPGDLLTCIVIQKLPFDPPSDPMIVMRGQMYTDSFNEYQIPRAILKFKQGFGRLIRTSKDKGSMVLLDSRISQSSYGPQFLESLPEGIKIVHCTGAETASHLSRTSP